MNRGKLNGNMLESSLYDILKKNSNLEVKCENEIKQQYHSFCSGVDIVCYNTALSVAIYIQCKFAEKPTPINDVSHFILSANCLQNEYIMANKKIILWVSKNNPSSTGLSCLRHHGGHIIANNDLDSLIKEAGLFVIKQFDIFKIFKNPEDISGKNSKNTIISYQNKSVSKHNYDAYAMVVPKTILNDNSNNNDNNEQYFKNKTTLKNDYDESVMVVEKMAKSVFTDKNMQYNIINHIRAGDLKMAIIHIENSIKSTRFCDYEKSCVRYNADIISGIPEKINKMIIAYNKLNPSKSQLTLVNGDMYKLYIEKKKVKHIFNQNIELFDKISTLSGLADANYTMFSEIRNNHIPK